MEKLEDLLVIDTSKNKAEENKKLLMKVKQLIKSQGKKESSDEIKAESLPYEAISVVGNKAVTIKFDLETKEAIVSGTYVDGRDTGKKNYMAVHYATKELSRIGKEQE